MSSNDSNTDQELPPDIEAAFEAVRRVERGESVPETTPPPETFSFFKSTDDPHQDILKEMRSEADAKIHWVSDENRHSKFTETLKDAVNRSTDLTFLCIVVKFCDTILELYKRDKADFHSYVARKCADERTHYHNQPNQADYDALSDFLREKFNSYGGVTQ